jgi:hypothetical protein
MNPHSNIISILRERKTYRNIRKYLKQFGLTKSEQSQIIKFYKEKTGQNPF